LSEFRQTGIGYSLGYPKRGVKTVIFGGVERVRVYKYIPGSKSLKIGRFFGVFFEEYFFIKSVKMVEQGIEKKRALLRAESMRESSCFYS